MPGYLPDGDVFITTDYDQAKRVLIADMEFDESDELSGVEQDLNLYSEPEPFMVQVGNEVYWLDVVEVDPEDLDES